MINTYSLYINGEFVKTEKASPVINPSNGKVAAYASVAGNKEVEAALVAARAAFDHGPWKNYALAQRKEYLLKISQGILDNAAELSRLETLNTGKPLKESTFMDIPSAAETFEYFANHLEQFLKDERVDITADIQGRLLRQPQGVVVLIVPWNYPLLIASWKLAAALAAGNAVILKPASLTPLSALALAKIIHEAGLPKGVVNVINASGAQSGELLCADRRVDMVSFTGSGEVGARILQYTSQNVKKMVMELGGKSASIVLADADLELAVNGSMCSIFLNQGQMCTAMSRIFVQESIYDAFIQDFVAKVKRIKLGEGASYETQMGPLISLAQREHVASYVEKARVQGATLLCGGRLPPDPDLQNGFFFEPTVFAGVTPRMSIFKEEVFGPVACISKFGSIQEALDLANESDYGLASCVWGKDAAEAGQIAARIDAGVTWVNTYGMFYNQLPYGGFKQSGFGKELGREGFLEYTRLKSVVCDTTKDAKPLVNYWYGF